MFKTCSNCGLDKPISNFTKHHSNKDGLHSYCRSCATERTREWRKNNPDKDREMRKKAFQKYKISNKEGYNKRIIYNICRVRNISTDEYYKLYEDQDHKCKICGIEQNNKRFHVDHDHITGKVRGLLCSNCNMGLGFFKDDISVMEKGIEYLRLNRPATGF